MIQHERQYNKGRQNEDALSNSDNESTIEDEIEKTSQAIAYVILPLIEVLSDLTNEDIEFAIEEPES
jgi:DNA polymerase III sliding clamp (beta) subunit (PCNA family)